MDSLSNLPQGYQAAWSLSGAHAQLQPGQANYLSGSIVCAGTSRALILSRDDFNEGSNESIILAVLKGDGEGSGLGGNHYQGNKAAVVWRAPIPNGFNFRFYQYDKTSDRLLADMECSNVAAGCAAYAVTSGLAVPNSDGVVYALNDGTGQQSMLFPTVPARPWHCDWSIRFLQNDFSSASIPMEPGLVHSTDGKAVEYWAFERGNAFVLANIHPASSEPDLLHALEVLGGSAAQAAGAASAKADVPKILLYDIMSVQDSEAWVDVACYFIGERHRSLPGSGVMTLAGFLTLTYLTAAQPNVSNGTFVFHMRHYSGELSVAAHWEREESGYRVVATEYVTPVSIIMSGSVFLPPGAADAWT